MSGLLEAWDWFDNSLQNVLSARGLPHLNKTQSMMMMYISAGVDRPIDMAQRMRMSRQAIRHISGQLANLGLLEINGMDEDKRGRRIAFPKHSEGVINVAEGIIDEVEQELRSRIGSAKVDALRTILELDWGEAIMGARLGGGQDGVASSPEQVKPSRRGRPKAGERARPSQAL